MTCTCEPGLVAVAPQYTGPAVPAADPPRRPPRCPSGRRIGIRLARLLRLTADA
ncbi:hypothetical protein [Streptomyces sp. NPDC058665]|uniref:hypothetical protein n=1 Tax=Streptomyces sp. NPDC058665 TaxID=3346586 RepID=UPI003662505E